MDNIKISFINNVAHSLPLANLPLLVSQYIGCQFALESNFGDSSLARTKQNYCGMKHPSVRPTLSFGSYNDFACYMSFEDCIFDFCLWLSYSRPPRGTLQCLDAFRAWLGCSGYCPEPTYISRIDSVFRDFCESLKY